jgi:arabinofuranosyltransferase
LFFAGSSIFAKFIADDAYITARYSGNLVNGNGLVFNIGEQVSALTSPFQAIVLAGFLAVTNQAIEAYKLVATLLVALTLFFTSRHFKEPINRVGFFALSMGSPFVIMWTQGGMETPLLLVCITLISWFTIEEKNYIVVMALASLAVIIRFDAVLFVLPVIIYLTWSRKLPPASYFFLTIPAFWLLFANYYYNDILPTSFYIKTPSANVSELLNGILYEVNFAAFSGLLIPIFVFRKRKCTLAERAVACGIAFIFLYGLTAGIKHMMFGYRLFVPFIPTVAMLLLKDLKLRLPHLITIGILQLLLFFVILLRTVNPSVGPFEYKAESLGDYANTFLTALDANRIAIQKHWQTLGKTRPLRIRTYTAGRTIYYLPEDAYVFEQLISYRSKCKIDVIGAADYIQLLVPRHGSLERQLGYLPGELIDRQEIYFDGQKESSVVYFNYFTTNKNLSAKVNEPC